MAVVLAGRKHIQQSLAGDRLIPGMGQPTNKSGEEISMETFFLPAPRRSSAKEEEEQTNTTFGQEVSTGKGGSLCKNRKSKSC